MVGNLAGIVQNDASLQHSVVDVHRLFSAHESVYQSPVPAVEHAARMVVACAAWELVHGSLSAPIQNWLNKSCQPAYLTLDGLRQRLDVFVKPLGFARAAEQIAAAAGDERDPLEQLLQTIDKPRRRHDGMYITPAKLSAFLADELADLLVNQFSLADAFADETTCHDRLSSQSRRRDSHPAFIQFLEPAMGTGSLVTAVVQRAHGDWVGSVNGKGRSWSDFVANGLLHRIVGLEINPIAWMLAHWNLARALESTGFDFAHPGRIQFELCDALQPGLMDRLFFQRNAKYAPPTVIAANPPFGALSKKRAHRLTEHPIDYTVSNGQAIKERKTWLHDHYVQFVQFMHAVIERRGCGAIGLITNRGYLDNLTFRGMRYQLQNSFDEIHIHDLYPDVKRQRGLGARNNPFGIAGGVAVSLFGKTGECHSPREPVRSYRSGRASKDGDATSFQPAERKPLRPDQPFYFFVPRALPCRPEYESALSLPQIMPVYGSTVITARDWLVTDTLQQRLEDRLREFADPSVPIDELRHRWFRRTRSPRYPPGDSRSWKLSAARQALQSDKNWLQRIERCQYRPLDERFVFWADYMIDWPRKKISDPLRRENGHNLALLTRRQAPPGANCNFFWITRQPALDGILRSDNRGNESVFPLKVFDGTCCATNFSAEFQRRALDCWGTAKNAASVLSSPDSWFAYIYALLNASAYQSRYSEWLQVDFPRIPLTGDVDLALSLVDCGKQLIDVQIHRQTQSLSAGIDGHTDGMPAMIKTFQFDRGTIWLNENIAIEGVTRDVWEFRVGAHQPARKWLKDRKGDSISSVQLQEYVGCLNVIQDTILVHSRIDQAIAQAACWETAFAPV